MSIEKYIGWMYKSSTDSLVALSVFPMLIALVFVSWRGVITGENINRLDSLFYSHLIYAAIVVPLKLFSLWYGLRFDRKLLKVAKKRILEIDVDEWVDVFSTGGVGGEIRNLYHVVIFDRKLIYVTVNWEDGSQTPYAFDWSQSETKLHESMEYFTETIGWYMNSNENIEDALRIVKL